MTRRRLVIVLAVLAIFAIVVGLFVPTGAFVENVAAIPKGTTRDDVEAKFGRPVYIRPLPVACWPVSLICVWELSDGWLLVNLDDDGRILASQAETEKWLARKRKRLKWAFGW
jgi:hypothetical protein